MDVNQILELLSNIPTWVWIVGGIILFTIVFGDKKLWEFEVKFPLQAGVGRGEIELECLKKKGISLDAEFQLEELFQKKTIEIFLNNKLICTLPDTHNHTQNINLKDKLEIEKPNEGDQVSVNIGGKKQFEGVLVRD